MTWRVMVESDFVRDGIAIWAGEKHGDRLAVVQPVELTMREHTEHAAVADASFHLPDELGRALLDALSMHYGGTTDTRTLRRDYDAERARVDRMIGHIIGARPQFATGGIVSPGRPYIAGERGPEAS